MRKAGRPRTPTRLPSLLADDIVVGKALQFVSSRVSGAGLALLETVTTSPVAKELDNSRAPFCIFLCQQFFTYVAQSALVCHLTGTGGQLRAQARVSFYG